MSELKTIAQLHAEIDTNRTVINTMSAELEELRKHEVQWDTDKARVLELEAENEELRNALGSTNPIKDFCQQFRAAGKVARSTLFHVLGIAATYQAKYFRLEFQSTQGALVKRKERRLEFGKPHIYIGLGLTKWGAEYGKDYFVITWKENAK